MTHTAVLIFHFWLSALMSVAGLAAILLKKGSRPHRLAGNIFFGVVPVSIVTGTVLTVMSPEKLLQAWVAAPGIYLALTGWATARRWQGVGRPFTLLGAALGAFLVVTGIPFALQEAAKPVGAPGGWVFIAVIAALLLWFTLLDVRVLLKGGATGHRRTARHVWRMGLSTIIVTASTLTAATLHYPKLMSPVLYIPAYLAIGLTLFWLIRTRFFSKRLGAVAA